MGKGVFWNDYSTAQHDSEKCFYQLVRKSFLKPPNHLIWEERCSHGATRTIDSTLIVADHNSPVKTIHWYDRDGNLERVTGYQPPITGTHKTD